MLSAAASGTPLRAVTAQDSAAQLMNVVARSVKKQVTAGRRDRRGRPVGLSGVQGVGQPHDLLASDHIRQVTTGGLRIETRR